MLDRPTEKLTRSHPRTGWWTFLTLLGHVFVWSQQNYFVIVVGLEFSYRADVSATLAEEKRV